MPRPPKAAADKKDITIKVRVTEAQERRLRAGADVVGLELSTWIRFVAIREADALVLGVEQAKANRRTLERLEARRRRE